MAIHTSQSKCFVLVSMTSLVVGLEEVSLLVRDFLMNRVDISMVHNSQFYVLYHKCHLFLYHKCHLFLEERKR